MSGFEIIGVVLGGLPLLISAAEDYREGFEPFLKWRRFRYEFRTFINNVDLEKQMFDGLVTQLLEHTDLSLEQKLALSMGQDPDAWRQKEIKDALRKRLGDSCDACIYLLGAIEQDFIKLQTMMSLKDGSVDWAKPGEDRWNYQRKRISHSFSKKGPETVASLGEKNRKFKDLLDMLDRKAPPRQNHQREALAKDTTWATIFECIRRQADNLHSALKNGWKCSCEVPHLTAMQLQKRVTGDWPSHFIMKFAPPADHKIPVRSQRKIMITVVQPKGKESSLLPRPQPTPVQDEYPTKISQLRINFETLPTSERHEKALPIRSSPHSTSAPTLSSITSGGKTITEFAFSSTTQLVIEGNSHSVSDFWRTKKPNKTVRMNVPPQVDLQSVSQISLPSELSANSLPPYEQDPLTKETCDLDSEIKDLCSTLETSERNVSCLGFLSDNEHRRYQLRSIKDNKIPSDSHDLISLQKLLDSVSKPGLNRKQRFRLAVVLASSLLQLQTTPWLNEKLEKKDIFFEYHGREVFADQPYIHHLFPSTKPPSTLISEAGTTHATTSFSTRSSLKHLGILLLELCFGEAIESQTDLRNNYLVDGKPHNDTDFLTALEWVSEIEQEAGLDFQGAVRCCFNFDVKPNWTDVKFTQSIYSGVVQPLEKVVAELGWADAAS